MEDVTFEQADGWYWAFAEASGGPFPREVDAYHAYEDWLSAMQLDREAA